MIRPEDFQIRVDYDEDGPLVIVGHAISGIERCARPTALESVGKVKEQLLAEIQREFCDVADIYFEHGRSSNGGFMRVIHLPTGINRGFQTLSQTSITEARLKALDEAIGEVWRLKVHDSI